MGGSAAEPTRPEEGGSGLSADDQLVDDVERIAESVRAVVGARATMISRVVDEHWLEVTTVAGEPSAGIVEGLRWERADLDSLLAGAERLGRLRATKHRTVSYVEVPTDTPETQRYVAHHQGLLIAPLHLADGELVGVLTTEGQVDVAHPPAGTCELVELYADQARLALSALTHRDALAELMRLDAYRRDLVALLTHDLKTPLTAISLNAELLESDGRLAEAGSRPVAAIRRSADRLADLVDGLVALARAEEGADPVTPVDLCQLVRVACGHAETEARLREVSFDVDAPEELWVAVHESALARVLVNLVGNAVKFSYPRGRVRLHLSRGDGTVEFRCTDEGIGIPADRLETLFDVPHRTADSRTEELPGAGIGLAICQRIVSRMGGHISVESAPGAGSTFTVRLPAEPAAGQRLRS